LYRQVRMAQANVGVCLQAYLYRTAGDVESLLPLAPGIRLVKGAYAEPPDRAYPRRADVDVRYLALGRRLLEAAAASGAPVGIGTHDGRIIRELAGAADALGLPRTACEFQMLYGIRREEQLRLRAAGHAVRVLISYGNFWYPWYVRRLAERPANVWFVVRSMFKK
jgi:proline dehydrogenase